MHRGDTPNQPVNIQVVVRCRPPSVKEQMTQTVPVRVLPKHDVYLTLKSGQNTLEKAFKFDQAYEPSATQESLYTGTIKPIVGEVLTGYNCTVFAYGQTGTGKTFTMEGNYEETVQEDGTLKLGRSAGVIPRAIQQIFNTLERSGCEYTVKLSILELYNEELHDMLAPAGPEERDVGKKTRAKLRLFDDASNSRKGGSGAAGLSVGGVTVAGLEEVPVRKLSEVLELMKKASLRRQIAETKLNNQSSRSHMITTVVLHMKETTDTGEDLWKVGKLNLVDLAGSENILRSGAQGKVQKEAGIINQSLLTLGRVINALVEGQPHVPYRESKLTRLLQDSLGGKTKTCIIATIAPVSGCLEETVSTLEYAHRAKSIKNRPEVNQRMTKKHLMKEIIEANEELQRLLMAQREKNGIYVPTETYEKHETERRQMAEQIAELEERLEFQQKRCRAKEKQVKQTNQVLSSLRQRIGQLEERNRQHMNSLEDSQSQYFSQLQGEMDSLQSTMGDMSEGVDTTLDTVNKWIGKIVTDESVSLGNTGDQLVSLVAEVGRHVESVKEWSGKLVSRYTTHEEAIQASILEFQQRMTTSTDKYLAASQASQQGLQEFLNAMGTRIQVEVCDPQVSALKEVADSAKSSAQAHAELLPKVMQKVSTTLEKGLEQVLHGTQNSHRQQWSDYSAAFAKLTDAIKEFEGTQQASLQRQEGLVSQVELEMNSIGQGVINDLQAELSTTHDTVVEGTQTVCGHAQEAMAYITKESETVMKGFREYSQRAISVGMDTDKLAKVPQQESEVFVDQLQKTQQRVSEDLESQVNVVSKGAEDFSSGHCAGIQEAQLNNKGVQDRLESFASTFSKRMEALDTVQHMAKLKAQLPDTWKQHMDTVKSGHEHQRNTLQEHVQMVAAFCKQDIPIIHSVPVQSPMEQDKDKEPGTPSTPTGYKSPVKVGTPVTDPQGRKHLRTPLLDLVNKECWQKGNSPSLKRTLSFDGVEGENKCSKQKVY